VRSSFRRATQRPHDGLARGVAARMQYARPAVRRLEVQRPGLAAAREVHALRFEPGDGVRCAIAGEPHGAIVVEAMSRAVRIGCVQAR